MAHKTMPDADYLRQRLSYDPEAGTLTWKARPQSDFPKRDWEYRRWNLRNAGKTAGSIVMANTSARYEFRINGIAYVRARIIWKLMTGADPSGAIDHIDRDSTNDRWANLRDVTGSQNQMNRVSAKNSGLPRGVHRNRGRFMATINSDTQRHYLGTFDTVEDASAAYVAARAKLHGEFAPRDG
jgi:hypothetical protein